MRLISYHHIICILPLVIPVNCIHDYKVVSVGEIHIQNDRETCGIVVPSTMGVTKLSTMQGRGQFVDSWHEAIAREIGSMCIEPTDIQDPDPKVYEEFLASVKSAELWLSDKEHELQLVCLDIHSDLVVSYLFNSNYGGGMISSAIKNPLPLTKSRGRIAALKGFLKGEKKREKLYLPYRNMHTARNPDKVLKPSFEAFQYCYEAFRRRQILARVISALPIPAKATLANVL